MFQWVNRSVFSALIVLATVSSADAALIFIDEVPGGGAGTLVHDGQGDVGSVNGSADGDALLMSSFGFTNGNLADDLLSFAISGLFTDNNVFGDPANAAILSRLWLIGTLSGDPLPSCGNLECGFLSDVSGGDTLGFDLDPVTFEPLNDTQNVLFAIPLVGNPVSGPEWLGPPNPSTLTPQTIPIPPGTVTYTLTPAQIAFIVGRMAGFSVDQLRFGLSVSASGVTPSGTTDIGSEWDIRGPAVAPEPATLLLFGTGLVAAGVRRLRRHQRH